MNYKWQVIPSPAVEGPLSVSRRSKDYRLGTKTSVSVEPPQLCYRRLGTPDDCVGIVSIAASPRAGGTLSIPEAGKGLSPAAAPANSGSGGTSVGL